MKKIILALVATAFVSVLYSAPVRADQSELITAISQVENSISVDWNETGTVAVQLIAPNGRIIHKISRLSITAGTSTTIPLDGVASGVYYMRVNNGRSIESVAIAK